MLCMSRLHHVSHTNCFTSERIWQKEWLWNVQALSCDAQNLSLLPLKGGFKEASHSVPLCPFWWKRYHDFFSLSYFLCVFNTILNETSELWIEYNFSKKKVSSQMNIDSGASEVFAQNPQTSSHFFQRVCLRVLEMELFYNLFSLQRNLCGKL